MNPIRVLWVMGRYENIPYLLTGSVTEVPHGFEMALYRVIDLTTNEHLDPDHFLWNDYLFNQWASNKLVMQQAAEIFDAEFPFYANDIGGLIN